jgi:ABC-2 type transport system ATP-binding protein
MKMDPVIDVKDVSVRYRLAKDRVRTFKEFIIRSLKRQIEYEDFMALKNVSLQLYPGEMVGIIGRNGAGKSTLLKLVANVMKPSSGSVSVHGKVAPLIELGTGFDPELSGRENIFFNGSILGMRKIEMERKYAGIVEFSELGEFLESPVRTYSSGMIARLGFAIATEVSPDILILDEILGVGDLSFQKKCLRRIEAFRESGVAILFVSHNLEQVRSACDKALWLDHGVVKAWGDTETVSAEYEYFSFAGP